MHDTTGDVLKPKAGESMAPPAAGHAAEADLPPADPHAQEELDRQAMAAEADEDQRTRMEGTASDASMVIAGL